MLTAPAPGRRIRPRRRNARPTARSGESSRSTGLVLLMCTRILRGRFSLASAFRVPPAPESGTCPICARRAIGDAEIDELALGPERAVHEHGIAGLESLQHGVAEPCEPRDIGQHAAGATVAEGQPDRLDVCTVSAQVAWCVATGRERIDLERRPVQGQRAVGVEGVPLHAAVVVEYGEHGIPVVKGAADRFGPIDLEGGRRLARQQQSRGVVDLRIGQQDPRHRSRANVVPRVGAQPFELLAQVRRGVGHVPGPVSGADRHRRLRSRTGGRARTRRLARIAAAVPLREPSPCG